MRLSAAGLACTRGNREVFSGLDFYVSGGEMLVVRGRNGAGKTSLLRLIAGLIQPAAGLIALEAGDPELTVPEQAHYVGHQDALKTSLSVEENLAFWARYLGAATIGIADALRATGLDALADLPAAYLSAGQRRRLSLARLIAARRPIWLLDEPTSALDSAAQARLVDLMRQHLAAGGLIMAATHTPLGLDSARELVLP
jgi:heme exporter protein A